MGKGSEKRIHMGKKKCYNWHNTYDYRFNNYCTVLTSVTIVFVLAFFDIYR